MRKAQPFQLVWNIQDRAQCEERFLIAYQNMVQQYENRFDTIGTLQEIESYNRIESS